MSPGTRILGLAAAAAIAVSTVQAQTPRPPAPPVDTSAVISLRFTDGTQLTGRVVARDDSSLTIVTVAGLRVNTPLRAIAAWRGGMGRVSGGHFRPPDPNRSRLFLTPTARTLPSGGGYFADYYLFLPFLGYGVTDRITVAGGVSLIPGATSQLLYIAPKVGLVQSPTVSVAVGGVYLTVPGEAGWVGAGYGVVTLGDEENALTVLGGYAFENGDRSDAPTFIIGGEHRIGDGSKLLVEAWKFPGADVVPVLFGVRWFGTWVAVDFGLIKAFGTSTEGFPFVPWVDFAVTW